VVQGATLVAFTLTAANMVLAPYIAQLYAAGDNTRLQHMVTRGAQVILLTALPVAGTFIFFGEPILASVFGDAYRAGAAALAILCLGQLVNAGAGSVGLILNMTGHERDTAVGVAAAAAANLILNLILIPRFGIEGAAVATAVSLATWNVLLCRRVYRRVGIRSAAFHFSPVTERQ
ncbi:MAG: polysaccharide biosynthesis C-terminal domain-containing protein, partial [Ardenticatenaceae bacterium]